MIFPRLRIPRPPQNTPTAPGSRPAQKPLGYVKPAGAPAGERSRGGIGRVTSHLQVPVTKAPAPPAEIKYDKYGRPTLTPDDVPFW